jgi:hypothetical protein
MLSCGGGGGKSLPVDSGRDTAVQTDGDSGATDTGAEEPEESTEIDLHFIPDAQVRLPCAAVPRVGWAADGEVVLYHGDQLTSGGGQAHARSADGLDFGPPETSEEVVGDPIEEGELPVILQDRDGFPGIVALPQPSALTWCSGGTHRMYRTNGNISSTFGDGLASSCSMDGRWFWAEPDDRVASVDGGDVGVASAVVIDGRIHVFAMDGLSPNADGQNRHRIWHYAASDDSGDVLELVSDDPLDNGETDTADKRYNDPQALPLSDGDVLLVSMQQHKGAVFPDSYRTGIIHGWLISADDPTRVEAALSDGAGGNNPLMRPETMEEGGHDVFSLNDPSVLDLGAGRYRLYMGALVDIARYPDRPEFADCVVRETEDGAQLAWAILSASSAP